MSCSQPCNRKSQSIALVHKRQASQKLYRASQVGAIDCVFVPNNGQGKDDTGLMRAYKPIVVIIKTFVILTVIHAEQVQYDGWMHNMMAKCWCSNDCCRNNNSMKTYEYWIAN